MKYSGKFVSFISILGIFTFILVGCNSNQPTGKFVGSRDTEGYGCDMPRYENLDSLAEQSELIIIGTAGGPIEVTEQFGEEILYASKIQISVKDVLRGTDVDNELYVLQTGSPQSDNYETKLKEGKEYVLFLNSKEFNGDKVYDCTGIEQGIIEIQSGGRLYSYVDFGVGQMVDQMQRSEIEKEIKLVQ